MSRLLWLWLPVIWLGIQLAMELTLSDPVLDRIHSENGPHELLQFFAIFVAFILACLTLARMDRRASPWLTGWVALAALCSFYVAGEEISWGQQFLHWTTPDYWDAVNNQHETNLHNTSSWLDQKPRWVLQAGMFTGGLLIPLLRRVKPSLLPARFTTIYPPSTLAVTAAIAAAIKIAQGVGRHVFHVTLFFRNSEVEELYMFWFVMLYMLVMKDRLTARRAQSITES